MKKIATEIILTIVAAIAFFALLQTTVYASIIEGSSMMPELETGQLVIINRMVYHFTPPQRGDIVTIHPPVAPEKEYIKRIIGLPGEEVKIDNGKVYINGKVLDEPYIRERPSYHFGPFLIPEDNYFVLGDNRNSSNDSHTGWTVTRENIIGKAWLRYWPLEDLGLLNEN